MKKASGINLILAGLLVVVAVSTRLIPHLPNFSPILAIALFSGLFITDKRLAVIIPLAAMLISDVIIGFHSTMLAVYLCFFIMVFAGIKLSQKESLRNNLLATIGGSVFFFLVTNFYFWIFSGMYPLTFAGLFDCYTMAIPFYRNAALGDIIYFVALYSIYKLGLISIRNYSTAK